MAIWIGGMTAAYRRSFSCLCSCDRWERCWKIHTSAGDAMIESVDSRWLFDSPLVHG